MSGESTLAGARTTLSQFAAPHRDQLGREALARDRAALAIGDPAMTERVAGSTSNRATYTETRAVVPTNV